MNQQMLLEKPAKKANRHVVIALNHLYKRLGVLLLKQQEIQAEIDEVKTAMAALNK